MREVGVAVVTVIVAVAVVVGSVPASAVAVDTYVDVDPRNPLYGWERFGESVKELVYTNDINWHLDRAGERVEEYRACVEDSPGNADKYDFLLEDYVKRVKRVRELADEDTLALVLSVLEIHQQVLEYLRENVVPPQAHAALDTAISESATARSVLEERFPAAARAYRENIGRP